MHCHLFNILTPSNSRSSSFQNEHKEHEEKILKIIERFKNINVSDDKRRLRGRISLASMKEDSKEDQKVQPKTNGPIHDDVNLIEYSCNFCDFKASDPIDIELHCLKTH